MNIYKNFLLFFLILSILILIKCENPFDSGTSDEYGSIKGKITDVNGDPLRGTLVSIEKVASGTQKQSMVTAAGGTFSFDDIKVGEYEVRAEKEGYLSEELIVTVNVNKTTNVDLILKRRETEKGIICGKVFDENSDPIEGVLLSTEPETHTDNTNSNGEYLLDNIPPGNYTVRAFKSGYRENSKSVTVESNTIVILDLPLISNASLNAIIYGRITDAQTGEAINDVKIETDPASHTALSDANGYFQITVDHSNIPPYIYIVKAKKDGYNESSVQTSVQKGNVSIVNILLFKQGSGPEILDIQVTNITGTSATISWRTDTASDSRVEYGPTTNMNNQPKIDYSYTTYHQITLENLLQNTMYYFRVGSCDNNGLTWSGQQIFNTESEYENETEPNDYKFQANDIEKNGLIFGKIGITNDKIDWYKLAIPISGRLKFSVENISENQSGGFGNIEFLNEEGNIIRYTSAGYRSDDSREISQDLASGMYYIKINCYGSEHAEYKLETSFTLPSTTSDYEPNNTLSDALNYSVGSSARGLIGYNNFFNYHDVADFYKLTISQNGRITIKVSNIRVDNSGGLGNIELLSEQGDRIRYHSAGYSSDDYVEFYQDIAPGNYYIKIRCFETHETAEYKLETSLTPPSTTSDNEPNNTLSEALNYSVGSSVKGLIGYSNFFDYHDGVDYYKFNVSQNGRITIKVSNIRLDKSGGLGNIELLNVEGNRVKYHSAGYSSDDYVEFYQDITPGTYYIKIRCFENETAEYNLLTTFN